MTEIIGYIGSFVIALSLLMKNVLKLRIVNLFGALLFVMYGFMIKAHAVWLVNLFIAIVDMYYIHRLKKELGHFRFVPMNYNELIEAFIKENIDDIKRYFPDVDRKDLKSLSYYIIIRNFVFVGIFGYKKISDKSIMIEIDYIVADWRDFKNAVNFFAYLSSNPEFKNAILRTYSSNKIYRLYLERLGFIPEGDGFYSLKL
ncbi:MAG: hypothetical protein ACP5IO_01570 [Elusimicrobiales bacterium]